MQKQPAELDWEMGVLTCRDVAERADQVIDVVQDVGPWDRIQFRLHLLICPNCRRFVSQFEQTVRIVGGRSWLEHHSDAEEQIVEKFRAISVAK